LAVVVAELAIMPQVEVVVLVVLALMLLPQVEMDQTVNTVTPAEVVELDLAAILIYLVAAGPVTQIIMDTVVWDEAAPDIMVAVTDGVITTVK
jgi:hypothetical protein